MSGLRAARERKTKVVMVVISALCVVSLTFLVLANQWALHLSQLETTNKAQPVAEPEAELGAKDVQGGSGAASDAAPAERVADQSKEAGAQEPVGARESLSRQDVEKVIVAQTVEFKNCQSRELLNKKAFPRGELLVRLGVESSGKVDSVHALSSSLRSTQLKECVLSVFSRAKFPEFKGPKISVSHNLIFE